MRLVVHHADEQEEQAGDGAVREHLHCRAGETERRHSASNADHGRQTNHDESHVADAAKSDEAL